MSAVAVAVVGGAVIGGTLSANAQKSAAKTAANAQVTASSNATQAQLQMWEQARQDFVPYLNAGRAGLDQLQSSLPNYIQQTIVPLANQYAAFTPQALPSANFMVNPVTGQVMQGTTQQIPQQTPVMRGTSGQPTGYSLSLQDANQTAATQNNALWGAYRDITNAGGNAKVVSDLNTFMASPNTSPQAIQAIQQNLQTGTPGQVYQVQSGDSTYLYTVPQTASNAVVNMQYNPATTSYEAAPNAMAAASQQDLTGGGVLSPVVPELYQGLNYQFDTNDPVYQQKLKEKTDQINAFLAKQGLLGSTPGETFRQNELNKLLAEEESRQYERALTERNYGTQTTVDQYALEAVRGESLYGRMYGQQSDLYNRMLQGTQLSNEQNLATLARPYGVAQDIYNTMYGSAANLANIGSNAAGMTGQQAISTGQGVASNLLGAGNAMAQSSLAQGQANAQLWNTLGNAPAQAMSYYNYLNPTMQTQTVYPQQYGYTANPSAIQQGNITGLNYY